MPNTKLDRVMMLLILTFVLKVNIIAAQRETLDKPRAMNQCRRCLDHFNNSYYCASTINQGTCCPFPTTSE